MLYFEQEQIGNNIARLTAQRDGVNSYLKANPNVLDYISSYSERYPILPPEILLEAAEQKIDPLSPQMEELCEEYTKEFCVQAANDWEAVKDKFQTNKYNDDMTMNLMDILGGLGSTAFFYANKVIPDKLEKVLYSEDGVRELPLLGKVDFQPDINKFGDTQTSLWAIAALDWFDENAVIWSPFPDQNRDMGRRTNTIQDVGGFYRPRGRVWAYAQQMNAYDRYLEEGYTKEYAQSNIPINLNLTQVEGIGEKQSWLEETKQWLEFVSEGARLAGKPYANEMVTRVVQNLPVNYNRTNPISVESLLAENMPEYQELVTAYGYTPTQAKRIIYSNIGEPIKMPDEGSEINWTSIQKPNAINAFAGTRFIYSPELAQDYEDIQSRNLNKGKLIPYSVGRYEASKFNQVGSTAYNIVSGAIDAENRVVSSLGLGAVTRTIKKGAILARQVDRLPELLKAGKMFNKEIAKDLIQPYEKYINPFTGESKVGPAIKAEVFDYDLDAPFKYKDLTKQIYKNDIKPAIKASRQDYKKYGLLGGRAPKFLSNTVDDIINKKFTQRSIQDMTADTSVTSLSKNPWLQDAPEEVLTLVQKSKTNQNTENILRRALNEGYVYKQGDVPWILDSIPKGSSALTNAAINAVTGYDPGLKSLGSLAGNAGNKIIKGIDKAGKYTSVGMNVLRGKNPFRRVIDGTPQLDSAAYYAWDQGGELTYKSNLGFASAFSEGMSPYWTKKFSVLPGSGLSYKNRQKAFRDVLRYLDNTGFNKETSDKLITEFITKVRKTPNGGSNVDDLNNFSDKLVDASKQMVATRKGDYATEMFDNGLEYIKNSNNQLKSYLADNMGEEIYNKFSKFVKNPADGTKVYQPALVKLSEAVNNEAFLYPVRRLNRIMKGTFFEVPTLQNKDHFAGPGLFMADMISKGENPFKYGLIPTKRIENDIISNIFDTWNSIIFKPTKIIKQALTARVGFEEQARFVFAGLAGIFNKPLEYVSWLYSYGQLPKRSRVRKLVNRFMDSGNDSNQILQSQYFSEAANANWTYQGLDLRNTSVKGYDWVAVDANSRDGVDALHTQIQRIRNNPMSRKVAEYGWSPELETWAKTREARDMAQDVIDETGDRYRGIIRKHEDMMEYLSLLEADIRYRTGHILREGVDKFTNADKTTTFNHDSVVFSGSQQLRDAMWKDKLLKFDSLEEINMMPDMEQAPFVKGWTRKEQNKILDELAKYIKGNDDIAGLDLGKVMMPTKQQARTAAGRGVDKLADFWNTAFNFLLTEPLGRLNRSPAWKQYRYMYIASQFKTYSKSLQLKYIKEFEDAAIPKKAIDVVKGYYKLGQNGKIKSYEQTSQLANQYAVKGTQNLLYDAAERHQLSEITRNIFPFPEVWFELGRTWGRLAAANPYKLREANLMYRGLQSSSAAFSWQGQGWFAPDPSGSGDDVFLFPLNKRIANLISPRKIGVEEADGGVTLVGNVTGVNLLSTSLTPGPNSVVAFAANKLFDRFNAKMELREKVFGPFAPPKDIIEAIVAPPPFLKKGIAAGNPFSLLREQYGDTYVNPKNDVSNWNTSTNEYDSMRAESTIDVYSNIRAGYDEDKLLRSGELDKYIRFHYPEWNGLRITEPDNSTNEGRLTETVLTDAVLSYSAHKAKSLFFIRAIAQEIFLTGFRPIFNVKDKGGTWWATQVLSQEYNTMVIKHGNDHTLAAEEFYVKYGIDHPYITAGSKENSDGTKKILENRNIDWVNENEELIRGFKKSLPFLVPDNPQAERNYAALWDSVTKRPDKFALQQNDSVAWFRYNRISKQIDEDPNLTYEQKIVHKRDARIALAYANPGFMSNYGVETYIPATEIWEEISTLWPQSELAMSQPSAQGLPEFLEILKKTEELSKKYSPTKNPDWWLSSTKPEAFTLRMQVAKEAYNIIEKHPEFWYIWNGVFIKLYNNDTEQLQYIGDMRDTR